MAGARPESARRGQELSTIVRREAEKLWKRAESPLTRLRMQRLVSRADKKEIRSFALKRSGSHAVLDWIQRQQPGRVGFCNNIVPGSDPLQSTQIDYMVHRDADLLPHADPATLRRIGLRDCLIHHYEERFLASAVDAIDANSRQHVGPATERYDVLILRNPLNLFASRIKKKPEFTQDPSYRHRLRELWKDHAREYLGRTRTLTNRVVTINYDRWFTDEAYRADRAAALDLVHTDQGLDEVSYFGNGSSFDGHGFHGAATQMNVLQRWTAVRDDPRFQDLVDDAELWALIEHIYDDPPRRDEVCMAPPHVAAE